MVVAWWAFLVVVSAINVVAWLRVRQALERRIALWPAEVIARRKQMSALAAVYVAGCGFRSLFPRADVQRIVLVDSWLSSVALGRAVATVAELCFALLWALWVGELGKVSPQRRTAVIARLIMPLIVFAEVSSWLAVITTSFLGNAIEQSTWTLCSVLIAIALLPLRNHPEMELRISVRGALGVCAAFVAFMLSVDIPMYVNRWLEQRARGAELLGFVEGLRAASTHWLVTREYGPWHDEMTWMALYFSVGVWISIGFAVAPPATPYVVPASDRAAGSRRPAR